MIQSKISDYRLCSFVMKIELDGGYLLYNTLTDSLVYLDNTEDIRDTLPKLIEMNYYVPIDFDELAMINKMRIDAKLKSSKRVNSYTIFTTLDCNARCFYCYEKGTPHVSMSEQTANDVADFIIRNSNGQSQDIRWFGGEPLVNENVIDIITEKLNSSKVKFHSRMISNGLLFNKMNILKAQLNWHLQRVQITLDGTKDVYQRTKAYIGAKGNEFERVLNNIEDLLNAKIGVSIRLNQDLYNTEDLINLVNLLLKKFENRKGFAIYNSLLFDDSNGAFKNATKERNEAFTKLQDILIQKGVFRYKAFSTKFKYSHCMADHDSSITINPIGEIGKCEHYPNDYLIGSIYKDNINETILNKWKETYPIIDKCKTCPIYPQCVRIKMCPDSNEKCSYKECENKIKLIREAVIKRYNEDIQQTKKN